VAYCLRPCSPVRLPADRGLACSDLGERGRALLDRAPRAARRTPRGRPWPVCALVECAPGLTGPTPKPATSALTGLVSHSFNLYLRLNSRVGMTDGVVGAGSYQFSFALPHKDAPSVSVSGFDLRRL
jgi:hypothetical protein